MRSSLVLTGECMRQLNYCVIVLFTLATFGGQAFAYPSDASADEPEWTEAQLEAEFGEELDAGPISFPDPLERVNRTTLAFNRGVDRWVLDPVTQVYRFVVPKVARRSLRRFLANIDSPVVFANDLLQREWYDAGVTVGRFGINSTVGVGGLFDPAEYFWIEGHVSDFGQTMALEGVPSGPYIVLPILGPTTVRDGIGDVVDIFFRPLTFLLGPVDQLLFSSLYGGGVGLSRWDAHADELEMLEQSSVDFYAALRNAYYQTRTAEIWERRSDHAPITTMAREYWPSWSTESEIHAAAD